MLTELEFEVFKAQFCDGTSWTATFLEPGGLTRWKCNACGKEMQDTVTISASSIFGTHYKPGSGIFGTHYKPGSGPNTNELQEKKEE